MFIHVNMVLTKCTDKETAVNGFFPKYGMRRKRKLDVNAKLGKGII